MNTAPVIDVTNPESAAGVGTELQAHAVDLAARVAGSTVATVTDLERAVADREALADMRRRVVEYFAPIKQMAYRLHRTLCDRENEILKPLDARDRDISTAMSAFKAEQDRVRQEQEREEQARRVRAQEDQAAHEAAALEASGDTAMAAALVEDAITAPAPVVALPDVTRGVAKFVRRWRWRCTGGPADVKQTPVAILARTMKLIPREYLTLDDAKIGAYVRAMKSAGSIPGIEIYSVDEPIR
jgi:hypothetical protein